MGTPGNGVPQSPFLRTGHQSHLSVGFGVQQEPPTALWTPLATPQRGALQWPHPSVEDRLARNAQSHYLLAFPLDEHPSSLSLQQLGSSCPGPDGGHEVAEGESGWGGDRKKVLRAEGALRGPGVGMVQGDRPRNCTALRKPSEPTALYLPQRASSFIHYEIISRSG